MSLKNLMVLVLSIALVTGAVLTGGCAGNGAASQPTSTQIIEDIRSPAAFTLIQDNRDNPDFVIIDVRTRDEVAQGYIENALNIDFYSATFRDELDNLDKNKTYLIYCRSGSRSGQALDIMAELGFREVYNISDGFVGWNAAGLPTTR